MTSLLVDENPNETSSRHRYTFLNVVALGNAGAGKSAVLNSLIGHLVLPTGENGATGVPIIIDLSREGSLSSKTIRLQNNNNTSHRVSASYVRYSIQERLSNEASEIYLKLRTSTAPPLKLIDVPGLEVDQSNTRIADYGQDNDAILLVIVSASQASEIASYRALKVAKEYDPESTRTVGIICKIDEAAENSEALACVKALLSDRGPPGTTGIPWVALIGQSVSIASAQSGNGENSIETEIERLKSILTGAPQSKLGRTALVDTLARQIRSRMKLRLPEILSGLQDKSKSELLRLGEQLLNSADGTSAIAFEFEDKFLLHLAGGGEDALSFLSHIFPGDIVKNMSTGGFGLVSANGENVLPIDQMEPIPLRKEDVLLVSRALELGETVTRLGESTEDTGVIVGLSKTVSLASGDDEVATDQLQRFREFFRDDTVFQGTWLGVVKSTTLSLTVEFTTDGTKLEDIEDPDPDSLIPVFNNCLEKDIDHPYHKGQIVKYESESENLRGYVKSHHVKRVCVDWYEKGNDEIPPQTELLLMRDDLTLLKPRGSFVNWFVGKRCIMNGKEYLVSECHPTKVMVLWKAGHEEELDSREVALKVDSTVSFEGEIQIGRAVRRLVQQMHPQPYFGIVSGVKKARVKVSWGDGTESMVRREAIVLADVDVVNDNDEDGVDHMSEDSDEDSVDSTSEDTDGLVTD